jgi:hypothetical protein
MGCIQAESLGENLMYMLPVKRDCVHRYIIIPSHPSSSHHHHHLRL